MAPRQVIALVPGMSTGRGIFGELYESVLNSMGAFSVTSFVTSMSVSSQLLARSVLFDGDNARLTAIELFFLSGINNVKSKAKITSPAPKRNGAPVPIP